MHHQVAHIILNGHVVTLHCDGVDNASQVKMLFLDTTSTGCHKREKCKKSCPIIEWLMGFSPNEAYQDKRKEKLISCAKHQYYTRQLIHKRIAAHFQPISVCVYVIIVNLVAWLCYSVLWTYFYDFQTNVKSSKPLFCCPSVADEVLYYRDKHTGWGTATGNKRFSYLRSTNQFLWSWYD